MYKYPLTLSFPIFSFTPQIEVKDANGNGLFSAAKKLISSKDEINVMAGGREYFKIMSQENRITDIPSNWDVTNAEGKVIGVVDDDFISAIDTSKFIPSRAGQIIAGMEISRALNLKALKMYWIKDTAGKKVGLIAPDKNSLYAEQLPLYQFVRQLPIFFRFITPHYYVRWGEQTVMELQKQRTLLQDTYTLNATGKFTDAEEPLLVNSVVLAVLYERERLKELYT
jgi:uncharacterized protein YxjI